MRPFNRMLTLRLMLALLVPGVAVSAQSAKDPLIGTWLLNVSKSTYPGTPPKSQVKGRRYDFGTVTKLVKSGGYDVVVLDRWTVPTVSDSRLAREGLPIRSYQGTPFTNQNTKAVWRIPARPAALVLLHHCTAADAPWQTRSGTVADLGSLPEEDKLVLLTLDSAGWMVRAENLPRCP